jgi:hypothetical protein
MSTKVNLINSEKYKYIFSIQQRLESFFDKFLSD